MVKSQILAEGTRQELDTLSLDQIGQRFNLYILGYGISALAHNILLNEIKENHEKEAIKNLARKYDIREGHYGFPIPIDPLWGTNGSTFLHIPLSAIARENDIFFPRSAYRGEQERWITLFDPDYANLRVSFSYPAMIAKYGVEGFVKGYEPFEFLLKRASDFKGGKIYGLEDLANPEIINQGLTLSHYMWSACEALYDNNKKGQETKKESKSLQDRLIEYYKGVIEGD